MYYMHFTHAVLEKVCEGQRHVTLIWISRDLVLSIRTWCAV